MGRRHLITVGLFCSWFSSLIITQVGGQESSKQTSKEEPTSMRTKEFHAHVVYSDDYLINLGGLENQHPFDIKKYQKIHNGLKEDKLITDEQTHRPQEVTENELLLVHSKEYLKVDLKDKDKVVRYMEAPPLLASLPIDLDRGVLKSFRFASGGTILASRLALKDGIGINIGGGYHHAKPNIGEGFCIYADVAVAIRVLQKEKLIKRAVVVDVDVHQGNGTILCFPNDDDVFTFSMHQGDIYPDPKEKGDLDIELKAGMKDDEYLALLKQNLPDVLTKAKADICFIVGGCDTLEGDPLAGLEMSHEGIVKRDQMIVDHCAARKLPVVFTTSGGYSKNAWAAQHKSIANLIKKYGLAKTDSVGDNQND